MKIDVDNFRMPLGSVVKLEGLNKLICIIGKEITAAENGKEFDYVGVVCPLGYTDASECYMFNEDDIEKLYAFGLFDDVYSREILDGNADCVEGLLPIGSVVRLKGATRYLAIIGMAQFDNSNPEKVYDYGAVLFPEGYESKDRVYVFDRDQIEEILHVGFIYEGQMEFEEKMLELLNNK